MMIPTVATEAEDTPTSVTRLEHVAMIGTLVVGYHQGQRSKTAQTGRTYDRSRPKRSERQKSLANRGRPHM